MATERRSPGRRQAARIMIGTSGWHYQSWRAAFFPAGLPLKSQLQYYASQFDTTELNGVFYRTPTVVSVRSWHGQTGKDFVFSLEGFKVHHPLETAGTSFDKQP